LALTHDNWFNDVTLMSCLNE